MSDDDPGVLAYLTLGRKLSAGGRPASRPGVIAGAAQARHPVSRGAFAACLLPGQAKRTVGTRCLKALGTLGGLSGGKHRDATVQPAFACIEGEL